MSSIWSRLINLAGNITGTLPVANGGTGLTSGTSGGILGYTASGTLASSGALTQHAVVVGGGAGATPATISAGTNGQLLVGSTGADPAFGSTVSAATTFSSGILNGNAASTGTGVTSNSLTNAYYEEATLVTTVTNFTGTPAITVRMVRNGGLITCTPTSTISDGTKANTSNPTLAAKLPTNLRPPVTYYSPTWIKNNGVLQIGIVEVDSDGTVTWLLASNAAWTSGAAAQIISSPFSFTAT